jgi:L-aspartate oxidase
VRRYDTIVVGSGIAGLFAAIKAATHGSVALVTKSALEESNTRYAQGGIAAATFADDSSQLHASDTLAAGAGLCNEDAVSVLCADGPIRVHELLALGVEFDTSNGEFRRGMEAAHSKARVLHSGGDATGARIESALANALRQSNVKLFEQMFLSDLVVERGHAAGVALVDLDGQVTTLNSSAVILATGGAGRLFRHTTNPSVATGDGTAAAFRAGALVADAEFFQFHPTALAGGDSFLISEAVRGEGAILRNDAGEAFMTQYDSRLELAPRDVVARAIADQMSLQDGHPIMLDATGLGSDFLAQRFPTITAHLRRLKIDWSNTPVPVTPAAHYWMGGVRTDTWGRSSVPGLYAIGETACTGVHGANRLASNSLLEGIVFAARAVEHMTSGRDWTPPLTNEMFTDEIKTLPQPTDPPQHDVQRPNKADIQQLMWDKAGLVRNQDDLAVATKQLDAWTSTEPGTTTEESEIRNMVTVARILTTAATMREESRGAHFRSDHPLLSANTARSVAFRC